MSIQIHPTGKLFWSLAFLMAGLPYDQAAVAAAALTALTMRRSPYE